MIRITRVDTDPKPSIVLEGHLDASGVEELRTLLDTFPNSRPELNLAGLKSVDDVGRRFLIDLSFQGHSIGRASLYVRHLLEEYRP